MGKSKVVWIVGFLLFFAVIDSLRLFRLKPVRSPKSNEASAVASCKAYVEAQEIFYRTDWDDDTVLEYAQTLPGLNDRKPSCVALVPISFIRSDLMQPNSSPKAGYHFKILKAQGVSAKDGAKSYLDGEGNMIGGFALVGCPGAYNLLGRNTFMVSHHGTVFSKDLGPDTIDIVKQMTEFNPDSTWTPVE